MAIKSMMELEQILRLAIWGETIANTLCVAMFSKARYKVLN